MIFIYAEAKAIIQYIIRYIHQKELQSQNPKSQDHSHFCSNPRISELQKIVYIVTFQVPNDINNNSSHLMNKIFHIH